ncbi:MAG: hypothetical protein HQM09_16135 [Candidatus Riflebacteria bacterium]|nr:hypothetical protein [Candidatus Riflebacteria bacterium]
MSPLFSSAAAVSENDSPITPSLHTHPVVPVTNPAEPTIDRHHLTVVSAPIAPEIPVPGASSYGTQPGNPPEMSDLMKIYRAQNRECWMCKKIAGAFDAGKDTSEDDRWHFTTCVTSWAHLQK